MSTTTDAPDVVEDVIDDVDAPEADAPDADDAPDGLGDKGKQAIDRMKAQKAAERAKRIAAEARVRELEALAAKPPEGEVPDPDKIRAEAKAEARSEALAESNARLVRAEIKAAAAGKLQTPALALKLIDVSQFDVDADGNVDNDEIADAISELLRNSPELAVQDGRRFQGAGDGGARTGSTSANDLDAQIAQATKAGDHFAAIALKQQRAALNNKK